MNYGSTVTLYVSRGAKPYEVGDYVCYAGNTYLYRNVPNSGGVWKGDACEGWIYMFSEGEHFHSIFHFSRYS